MRFLLALLFLLSMALDAAWHSAAKPVHSWPTPARQAIQVIDDTLDYLSTIRDRDYPLVYFNVMTDLEAKELAPFDAIAFHHKVKTQKMYVVQKNSRQLFCEVHYLPTGNVSRAVVYGRKGPANPGPVLFEWTYEFGRQAHSYKVSLVHKTYFASDGGEKADYIWQQVSQQARPGGGKYMLAKRWSGKIGSRLGGQATMGQNALFVDSSAAKRVAITEGVGNPYSYLETRKEEVSNKDSATYELRVRYCGVRHTVIKPYGGGLTKYGIDPYGGLIEVYVMQKFLRREDATPTEVTGYVLGNMVANYACFCNLLNTWWEYASEPNIMFVYKTSLRDNLAQVTWYEDVRNEYIDYGDSLDAVARKRSQNIGDEFSAKVEYDYTFYR